MRRNLVEHRHLLARERQQRRAVAPLQRRGERAGGFLGIAGADHVEIRNHPQRRDRLDRLVRRAVLAHADGVVREDVDDGQVRRAPRAASSGREVVGEHQEGRARRAEHAVVGDAVAHRRHRVLANAEADVAAGAVRWIEILVRRRCSCTSSRAGRRCR